MTDHLPPADLHVDAAVVMRLCASLQADPGPAEPGVDLHAITWRPWPRLVGEGWDNTMWEVGELPSTPVPAASATPVVLRVPRRRRARALLASEALMLRRLGPDPTTGWPRLLARTEEALLVTWIEGATAVQASADERRALAPAVVRILATLHRPLAPTDPAPGPNPVRGIPLDAREAVVRAELAEHRARADSDQLRRLASAERIWEDGLHAPPWQGPPLLLHGDPHPGNLVLRPVPGDGAPLTEPVLIDFGDATLGDPASDLGALWLLDPAEGFWEAYFAARAADARDGDDDALRRRARAWAVRYALALDADPSLTSPSLGSLTRS